MTFEEGVGIARFNALHHALLFNWEKYPDALFINGNFFCTDKNSPPPRPIANPYFNRDLSGLHVVLTDRNAKLPDYFVAKFSQQKVY